MKVLVLTGSPHVNGTTALLANEFCAGAEAAGHDVTRFNTGSMKIKPCLGCMSCTKNSGKCVHEDDMAEIYPHLMDANTVAFISPVYYYGMTSQLKCAIDRFFAVNNHLQSEKKQAVMISVSGDDADWAMDGIRAHFSCICRYLGWEEKKRLLAMGYFTPEDIKESDWPAKVRALGQGL